MLRQLLHLEKISWQEALLEQQQQKHFFLPSDFSVPAQLVVAPGSEPACTISTRPCPLTHLHCPSIPASLLTNAMPGNSRPALIRSVELAPFFSALPAEGQLLNRQLPLVVSLCRTC